ncbi:putative phosphate transport system protein [Methanocella paludicola SANAE]|uniref:Phosphate transport system protein n=1 Tax=Methanocella paludicola (strain DSM 17711 / JCM 13418 / NBRC 101707 / SANAE) TaxID=304371 RepID=D1YZT4_METPS|nr:phosphate uptake regulator PhoU [Methanocella paludicola]BAI61956.1 putative phosphate transport system protein [Methanocella paludicola SANAE]
METRKVQLTGGTTLIVSLPKSWVNKVNLSAGDEVTLKPQSDGSLSLRTRTAPEIHNTKLIYIEGKDGDNLVREVIAAYIAGYTSIELKANKILSKQRDVVRKTVNMLIGPEIIEETLDKIVLQDILNPAELSVKKSIRRMHMITRAMQENAIRALKEKDFDLAKDVMDRDSEVDKLYLLVSKQFRMVMRDISIADKFDMSMEEHLDMRLASTSLERIGDHATKICNSVVQIGDKEVPADIVRAIDDMNMLSLKIVDDATDALFKKNIELANTTFARRDDLNKRIRVSEESVLGLKSDLSVPVGIILDSIERTSDYGCNIAEIAINSAVSGSNP